MEHYFRRIEHKFLLPKDLEARFRDVVGAQLQPSYPDPETRYNLIESLYLDSSGLDSFRSHFLSTGERFKIRLRRYGPNGLWENDRCFLELKTKTSDNLSEKSRREVGPEEFKLLCESGTIARRRRLVPMCRIRYKRHAFEGAGIRVTFDDDLTWEVVGVAKPGISQEIRSIPGSEALARISRLFLASSYVLLELKHSGVIPRFLLSHLERHELHPVNFSKYCFAVSRFHLMSPGEELGVRHA